MKWLIPRQKTGFSRRAELQQAKSYANQKFDGSTGQIYTEIIAAIQTSNDWGWERSSRVVVGPSYRDNELYAEYLEKWERSKHPEDLGEYRKYMDQVKNSRVRGLKGARSLQDSAIECILQNISDITLEGIECLPSQIVRQVWQAVNSRCTMCFNTWRIFSKILHDTEMPTLDLLRHRQVIVTPRSPLPVYTNVLTSKCFDFITSLSITVDVSIPDLVQLSQVTNLGVLEIVKGADMPKHGGGPRIFSQGVGDRIIRAWHAAVLNEGAFRVLRILKLWNHDDLTLNSLEFVASFPALAIYDVVGSRFGAEAKIRAQNFGWKLASNANILDQLDDLCQERATLMQCQVPESQTIQRPCSQPLWDEAKVLWVPRAEIPDFYIRNKTKASIKETALADQLIHPEVEKKSTKRRLRNRTREYPDASEARGAKMKAPTTWDFPNNTAFARIGELRSDSDLARAGVPIGDQAVIGDELVNSLPMMSFCLGPTHKIATSQPRQLVFIRIEAPSLTNIDTKTFQIAKGRLSNLGPPNAQHKHPGRGVMRAKKRKLDDVLGSFL